MVVVPPGLRDKAAAEHAIKGASQGIVPPRSGSGQQDPIEWTRYTSAPDAAQSPHIGSSRDVRTLSKSEVQKEMPDVLNSMIRAYSWKGKDCHFGDKCWYGKRCRFKHNAAWKEAVLDASEWR